MYIVNTKLIIIYTITILLFSLLIYPLSIDAQTETTKLSYSLDETNLQIGENFTLHINIENVNDLSGWQCKILFDPEILEAVEVIGGDFLKQGGETPFFQSGKIDNEAGNITGLSAARFSKEGVSGTGRLLSVTFTAKATGNTQITLSNLQFGNSALETIPISPPEITINIVEQSTSNIDATKLSFSIDEISIHVGDTFTLHLNVENVIDLSGWQFDVAFDPNIIEAVEIIGGDFLKQGGETPFFQSGNIDNEAGNITGLSAARFSKEGVSGTGILLTIKFRAKNIGEAQVTLVNLSAGSSDLSIISLIPPEIAITVEPQPEPDVEGARLSFSIEDTSIRVKETFILHLNAEEVTNLAGWICDIEFDPATLEVIQVSEGDFLKQDGRTTFFLENAIDNAVGKITGLGAARFSKEGISGVGTLLSVTFIAKAEGESNITIRNLHAGSSALVLIPLSIPQFVINVEKSLYPSSDVNQDGQVDILDIMQVAQYLREEASVNPQSDVNGDGIIGILDLIEVAQHINESTASAPNMITNLTVTDRSKLTPSMIRAWIRQAQLEDDGSIVFQKGIAHLQRLLSSLIPEKTTLLANYPNPFNPETWIPYHLSRPSEVSLIIYNVKGQTIRTLVLGHQDVGIYRNRSRAAYWDGKNDTGETVASGIYFYMLSAGDFIATKKMLIRK